VSSVRIVNNNDYLVTYFANDGIRTEYVNKKNERFPIHDPGSVPPVARAEFARYWPFLLRDLNFRIRRRDHEATPDLFSGDTANTVSQLAELANAITRDIAGRNEATSAIRTKPQRTYTPGTEKEDGEGSHVPYEIAKRYRSRTKNRSAWEAMKEAIERFGRSAEMFKEISVKSFGQTASDPFQIQFSYDGPRTNLVDLGYGTSQILPILYSIAISGRDTRFLVQQPEVHLHPKAQA